MKHGLKTWKFWYNETENEILLMCLHNFSEFRNNMYFSPVPMVWLWLFAQKSNISKLKFDQNRGTAWKPVDVASPLNSVMYSNVIYIISLKILDLPFDFHK